MTRQTTPFELTVEESCANHSLNVIVLQKRIAELEAALKNKGCARDQTTTQYCAEVIERDKRIAELEAALATARRDAMEEAAKIAENCEYPWLEAREAEYEAADLMIGQIAIVIRAALKGGKDGQG